MELHLTDHEVKDAIWEWLRSRMNTMPPMAEMKIRRLYYNEGAGFEAVVDMPAPEADED